MFSKSDLEYLEQSLYDIVQLNNHDVTIHSRTTDHEWIVVSNYETPDCYILHRHFLYGYWGFINAVTVAFFRFAKFAKWYEHEVVNRPEE